jgi:hypothetical protein
MQQWPRRGHLWVEIEINATMAPEGSPMGRIPTNEEWPRRGHLWVEIEINATMAPAGSPMGRD